MPPKTLRLEELDGPLYLITGTRPGIVKFAPIFRELARRGIPHEIIHSGQHYSPELDAVFFEQLELERPRYRLDVVRHFPMHGEQTAEMLKGMERILFDARPRLVLVGGDCNTHLAGALAARKLHMPIGHVEAGMRGYDWRVPEEHNRVIIDHISEHLFVHDETAARTLRNESVRGEIHVVGTTIADALLENRELADARSRALEELGVGPKQYLLVTTHREENVDDPQTLEALLEGLADAAERARMTAVLPLHPRTTKRIAEFGLEDRVTPRLRICPPQGYLDFVRLLGSAAAVVTDSGGVQQEACILGVPCVTVRPTTEWTETLAIGANRLATAGPELADAVEDALRGERTWTNPFPPGATGRLVDVVEHVLAA